MTHEAYMARAIQLARQGWYSTRPNPRVGCVLIKDGTVIGEGFHRKAGKPHAEINALNAAGAAAQGATAYVTLEPCSHFGKTPPCANALIEAGVSHVVVAMTDPNPAVSGSGIQRLRAAGIEVTENILQAQAEELNPGFIKRMSRGMPYVRLKMAMSLDGRTAMASGESKWISSSQSRADVHRMRAASGAMLTGINTVMQDDPSLTFRVDEHESLAAEIPDDLEQPLRVVCDSKARLSLQAKILSQPGTTLLATTSDISAELKNSQLESIRVSADEQGKVSLPDVLRELANRQINDVMVEAGAGMAGALLQGSLVDELIIYMAPHLMGDQARGLASIPGLDRMADRLKLKIIDIRAMGSDWKITARPDV